MSKGGEVAKRAFAAMMEMQKIDVVQIEAAVRGGKILTQRRQDGKNAKAKKK